MTFLEKFSTDREDVTFTRAGPKGTSNFDVETNLTSCLPRPPLLTPAPLEPLLLTPTRRLSHLCSQPFPLILSPRMICPSVLLLLRKLFNVSFPSLSNNSLHDSSNFLHIQSPPPRRTTSDPCFVVDPSTLWYIDALQSTLHLL